MKEVKSMSVTLSNQDKIWNNVLERAKLVFDRHTFDMFFASTKISSIVNDVITVITDTELSKNILNSDNKTVEKLREIVNEVTETNYQLKFVLKSDETSDSKQEEVQKHVFFQQCNLNPKYSLDNYVVGSSNKEAVQAALMIGATPGETFNPLFIYAKSGLGKTHLLHAIGNYIKDKKPFYKVLYITTDAFIDEFIKYVKGDQQNESLKDFMRSVDVLLVDDIQQLKTKEKTQEMFFNVFNLLVNNGKQIVLTSDCSPSELKGLEERLVSRFSMGLIVNIKNPDVDTCIEILKTKIAANNLNINNFEYDGLVYLAETFSKNIRELEGALNRVIFKTIANKYTDKIDVETIKESVEGLANVKAKENTLSEARIIEAVGDYYNLTEEQIKSKIRTSQIALARHISIYLCRDMLNTPLTQLGKIFGGRDHTTIMSSVEKVEKMLKTDADLKLALDAIKKTLK
jgi:chromosomal replication initiator protein